MCMLRNSPAFQYVGRLVSILLIALSAVSFALGATLDITLATSTSSVRFDYLDQGDGQFSSSHDGIPFEQEDDEEQTEQRDDNEDEVGASFVQHFIYTPVSGTRITGTFQDACAPNMPAVSANAEIPLYILFHSWKDHLMN